MEINEVNDVIYCWCVCKGTGGDSWWWWLGGGLLPVSMTRYDKIEGGGVNVIYHNTFKCLMVVYDVESSLTSGTCIFFLFP